MSLISDVDHEIKNIDYSQKSIKKFRFTLLTVVFVLFVLFNFKSFFEFTFDLYQYYNFANLILILVLLILLMSSLKILSFVYKYWMAFSFVLGWFVSRVILTMLFYIVLTPTSITAKIFKKKFLYIGKGDSSLWIKKDDTTNYEKMY